jgi:hypothetical protein
MVSRGTIPVKGKGEIEAWYRLVAAAAATGQPIRVGHLLVITASESTRLRELATLMIATCSRRARL